MAKIDLSNISHSYNPNDPNPVYALNPFSMTWENGNRYAILGPSGMWKNYNAKYCIRLSKTFCWKNII